MHSIVFQSYCSDGSSAPGKKGQQGKCKDNFPYSLYKNLQHYGAHSEIFVLSESKCTDILSNLNIMT